MMKQLLLLISFLISAASVFGQSDSTVNFVAYWHVGDIYDFKVTKIKKDWRDGELTRDDSSTYIATFEVLEETDKRYKIKYSLKEEAYSNLGLNNVGISDEYLKVAAKHPIPPVIYTTTELGEFEGITNWREISKSVEALMDELLNTIAVDNGSKLKRKDFEKIMSPLLDIYSSKEGIEQLVFGELQFMHFPYGLEYNPTDTIFYEDQLPNMMGGDPIRGDAKLYFESVDFEEEQCVLQQRMTLNPDDMRELINTVFKKMGLDKIPDMEEMIEMMEFDVQDKNTYNFYYYPGVPIQIDRKRETVFEVMGKGARKIEILRIELVE
jgi:hypothetical protein